MLDRSGLPNEDGQSHQGLFDFAYLRHIPNMTVLSPADADELKEMVHAALALNPPCSIRYPKNAVQPNPSYPTTPFAIGRWRTLLKGGDGTILATGSMVGTALHAAQRLRDENVNIEVVNASSIVPLDAACIERVCAKNRPIITIEEHVTACGFGSAVLEHLSAHGLAAETHLLGVDNKFVPHGDHESLLKDVGLDDETVLKKARSIFSRKGEA